MPEPMVESQLFGHGNGVPTGTNREHSGLFQGANGGTVFLDGIADMSPALQARVLNVVERREVHPPGVAHSVAVDVRIISATHQDLENRVRQKMFDEDLYRRLNTITLELPPLEQRRGDIAPLAEHFLQLLSRKYGKAIQNFSPRHGIAVQCGLAGQCPPIVECRGTVCGISHDFACPTQAGTESVARDAGQITFPGQSPRTIRAGLYYAHSPIDGGECGTGGQVGGTQSQRVLQDTQAPWPGTGAIPYPYPLKPSFAPAAEAGEYHLSLGARSRCLNRQTPNKQCVASLSGYFQ